MATHDQRRCSQLLLGVPSAVLDTKIAAQLPLEDRLRLSETCRATWAASNGWFPEVEADLSMRSSEAIDALAAWLRRTKAEARISFNEADPIAALDALRGTSVVAIEFSDCVVIPASTLSHHPSLTRLCFDHSEVTPLRDLAGFTQLHGLRELVCIFQGPNPPRHQLQLQHALPLSQLEVLDIDGMQIVGADAGLAALTRLRELRLSNSDLRTVPASMASLTRLTRLSLDAAAQGAGGWRHLPLQLEYLKIIGLYGGLTAMPPELSRLTRLSQLDVSWNDLGDAGPDVALPTNLAATLQLLDISFNSLTEVPAALAPMTGLRQLNLSGNYHIAGSWQHLTGMKQLERLRLTDCDLAAVPEVLSQLTALTSVDLSRILIASDWQHPSSS